MKSNHLEFLCLEFRTAFVHWLIWKKKHTSIFQISVRKSPTTTKKNSDKNANGGSSSADWSTCLTVKNLWTWSKTSHLSKWTICWQFSSLYTKTRRKLMISFWSLLKKMRKILEFDEKLVKETTKVTIFGAFRVFYSSKLTIILGVLFHFTVLKFRIFMWSFTWNQS